MSQSIYQKHKKSFAEIFLFILALEVLYALVFEIPKIENPYLKFFVLVACVVIFFCLIHLMEKVEGK